MNFHFGVGVDVEKEIKERRKKEEIREERREISKDGKIDSLKARERTSFCRLGEFEGSREESIEDLDLRNAVALWIIDPAFAPLIQRRVGVDPVCVHKTKVLLFEIFPEEVGPVELEIGHQHQIIDKASILGLLCVFERKR